MNKAYKSIYNERTGTFVAVSENSKARGKRSSSRVRAAGGLAAAVAAGALFMGSALADVVVDEPGNTIEFTTPGGNIDFQGGGTITGLTGLTVGGALSADQVTVGANAVLNASSMQVVTGQQLFATNQQVTSAQSAITTLQGRVGSNETAISGHETRITNNETAIADHETRITGNEGDIAAINNSLSALGVDGANPGVKYFRANSTAADAQASGAESVAIGPRSVASGNRGLAAGDDARATGVNSAALGAGTRAGGTRATAVGYGANASSTGAVAVGDEAAATGGSAVAVGDGASAAGGVGIAVGSGAVAAAQNNISIGEQAGVGTVGRPANDWQNNIAIGAQAGQNVQGQRNVAMGSSAGNGALGNDNVALGENAGSGLDGDSNISIGRNANVAGGSVDRVIAIGESARAGTDGVAMGSFASAAGINGVAIGISASTQGSGVGIGRNTLADSGFVALGSGSRAVAADVSGAGAFTNNPFTGSAVSVGSSEPGNEFTRRIVNVEDGANDTDAVNVRQLRTIIDDFGAAVDYDLLADKIGDNWGDQIAAAKPKYLSINDGGTPYDNVNNDGAGGIRSIALGPDASTSGANSTAVGSDVEALGDSSVAMGHDAKAVGAKSVVIGNDRTEARDDSGVAIGNIARSRGANSIVIGTDSEVDDQDGTNVQNSIVIGTGSVSSAQEGIVIGRDSLVNAARGIAQGDNAEATAVDAMAFGSGSRASGVRSQAQGTDARASGMDSIAIGSGSRATQARAVAQGQDAQATAVDAMAFGTGSRASGTNSQASGNGAVASAANAQASGTGAAAGGTNAQASGTNAQATGTDSIAVGTGASAAATNASAFGQGATAGHIGAVALGSGAVTAAAVGTSSMTVDKNTYNFAGTNPIATVSVGAPGAERTITNVAAGRVSATSTDAINGSQLYGTNVALDRLADNLDTAGQSVADALGGGSSYNPTTHQVTANLTVNGNTYNNVQDALGYVGQGWNISADGGAAGNVAPGGSVDFGNTDDNIVVTRDGTNMTFNLANDIEVGNSITVGDTVIEGDSITTNNLTVGGETRLGDNFVVNNAGDVTYNGYEIATQNDGLSFAGNTGTDIAKTLGDNTPLTISGELAAGADSTGANLRVDSDGNQLNLVMAQNLTDLSSITINNGGPVIHEGGINMNDNRITNLAPGEDGTDAVNLDQLEAVEAVANAGWNLTDAGGNEVNIGPDGLVTFQGDSNISVEQTGADQDGVIEIALNRDLDVDSVTAGDSVLDTDGLTVDDGAGNRTEVGAGTIEVAGAGSTTIIGGNRIVVGGGNPVTIDGDAGTIGGLTNKTWNPDGPIVSGQAATEDQLMLVSQAANAGWNVSVGGEGALADNKVGPNGVVDFSNTDGNIEITRNGTDLEFNLNKDVDLGSDGSLRTGNTLVNNDGLAVNDGAGNSTTTTVAGTTVTNSAGDTTTLAADGTTVSNAAGDSTTVGAGTISVADAGGNTTTIGSTQVMVGGSNPVTIDGESGTIGGLTNKTWNPDGPIVSGQAATEDQLMVVSETANAGWNLTDAEGNDVNIGPNGLVTFEGDDNITVAQTGDDQDGVVEITLNKDVDLGPDGSLTTGDTVINNGGVNVGGDVHLGNTGLTINNGPSVTIDGINAGNMRIVNVAAGVNDTDAVNYGQLRPIESFIDLDGNGTFAYNGTQHGSLKDVLDSMHWNVEAPAPDNSGDGSGGSGGSGSGGSGGGSGGSGGTPIHNGNTVGFVEGDNIVISKTERSDGAGADIKVSVAQDIKVNSITAVKVQADEIQISNGGPVINENGIDMSGKPITNVAAGVNETDAVNVGQLQQATGNLQGQVNSLRNDVRRLDNKLSAGVAAAMATAALPQAYLPGKNMMAMAGGTWNGESGMAIGFSGITDNGKWIYKLSGNATSRGDYGGAVGIGYQW
ncbi:YadA-like family protein [Pusillimonas caeni]|uniref:YadA-like family protein n=1 Tax=Pusillimonas caeni TaxID=1348472 RepID=UPI001431E4D7|nr:YadA-like family protein [Pusillimonas caeni]